MRTSQASESLDKSSVIENENDSDRFRDETILVTLIPNRLAEQIYLESKADNDTHRTPESSKSDFLWLLRKSLAWGERKMFHPIRPGNQEHLTYRNEDRERSDNPSSYSLRADARGSKPISPLHNICLSFTNMDSFARPITVRPKQGKSIEFRSKFPTCQLSLFIKGKFETLTTYDDELTYTQACEQPQDVGVARKGDLPVCVYDADQTRRSACPISDLAAVDRLWK